MEKLTDFLWLLLSTVLLVYLGLFFGFLVASFFLWSFEPMHELFQSRYISWQFFRGTILLGIIISFLIINYNYWNGVDKQ